MVRNGDELLALRDVLEWRCVGSGLTTMTAAAEARGWDVFMLITAEDECVVRAVGAGTGGQSYCQGGPRETVPVDRLGTSLRPAPFDYLKEPG